MLAMADGGATASVGAATVAGARYRHSRLVGDDADQPAPVVVAGGFGDPVTERLPRRRRHQDADEPALDPARDRSPAHERRVLRAPGELVERIQVVEERDRARRARE